MFFTNQKSANFLPLRRWLILALVGYTLCCGGFTIKAEANAIFDQVFLTQCPELHREIIGGLPAEMVELNRYINKDSTYKNASKEAQKALRRAKYMQIRKRNLKSYIQKVCDKTAYIKGYIIKAYRALIGLSTLIAGLLIYKIRDHYWASEHQKRSLITSVRALLGTISQFMVGWMYRDASPPNNANPQELTFLGKIITFSFHYTFTYLSLALSVHFMSWLAIGFKQIVQDYKRYHKYQYLRVENIHGWILDVDMLYIDYLPQLSRLAKLKIMRNIGNNYKDILSGYQEVERQVHQFIIDIIQCLVPADKPHPMKNITKELLVKLKEQFIYLKNMDEVFDFWCQVVLRIDAKKNNAVAKGLLSHEVHGNREIILIHGRPGSGKTHITKTVLEACGIPYVNGDLSGNIFEDIAMLHDTSRAPLAVVLDDGDRCLGNKNISAADLALFDPARKYFTYTYEGEAREIRWPDIVFLIVNSEIEDPAIQDRFTLKCKMKGFTPEGKLAIAKKLLKEEIERLRESGYAQYISESDFGPAEYKALENRITPNPSIRPEIYIVKQMAYTMLIRNMLKEH